MRFDDVFVAGCGTWLPPAMSVGDAIAEGLCEPALAAALDMASVTIAEEVPAPEMAARAARVALARAAVDPSEVDLLLHASFYYQGHDLWAPASYVHRVAVGNACPAIQIGQVSNGGMVSLELAASYLLARPGRGTALLTTGDRFCPPGFDRWHSDTGTLYADGGTALVLSRTRGFARLRSVATVGRSELEGMHRGAEPFGPAPFSYRKVVEMDAYKDAFVAEAGRSFAVAQASSGQREAIERALADAGTELAAIDWFVLPHLGRKRLSAGYFGKLGVHPGQTTWPWSRTVGHLGAGDQFAGLEQLVRTGAAGPGSRCLLVGVGAGFSWSGAVVEVLERPEWAERP
ncbi:ketoacyl-ACP synthase III family protein [Amycolatopsis australiensis]|uniref:ketoacyl-ACP synthase III family protein n=1 Tax=Amycolatopsis australiensis TaxID=546364 RepID=UPI000930DDBA|nr:ketoacyl-ACP synthase III family protein [Amycolatopsis australiensis]